MEAEADVAAAKAELNPGAIPINDIGNNNQANFVEPNNDQSTVYGDDDGGIIDMQDGQAQPVNPDAIIVNDDEEDVSMHDRGAGLDDQGAELESQGAASDDKEADDEDSEQEDCESNVSRRLKRKPKERDFYGEWIGTASSEGGARRENRSVHALNAE